MRPCDGVDERIKHQGHLPDPLHVPCMVERRWVVGWSDELGLLGLLAPLRNLSPATFGRPAPWRLNGTAATYGD